MSPAGTPEHARIAMRLYAIDPVGLTLDTAVFEKALRRPEGASGDGGG
ncbi:hypothetical protein ACFFMN_12330 [Planobispora siamensis]|uniref:Uncharacterized protein n=1 Tax=Planobispora siamensis TaxID=936338 RepID=A0A8J3S7T2_9ACTN|nr:hypothetical protein [Planobispora siamensis]GIH89861.1 hypothetical protein Psi01_04910 [Planobispora siamensis]